MESSETKVTLKYNNASYPINKIEEDNSGRKNKMAKVIHMKGCGMLGGWMQIAFMWMGSIRIKRAGR